MTSPVNPPPSDQLEHLAVLGELTGSVAHEFNNILNNIMLHLAVLEQKGLSPELRAETTLVKQAGRQAAGLIRQLQQYCQEKQPAAGPVDLAAVLRESVEGPIPLEIAADLPPVLGNAADLKRLVGLLLAHAQAVAPGSIRVRASRCNFGVCLEVEDGGPAIAADMLARQFHPFVITRPGDDGVRLAVSKHLMKRLQGLIRGENREAGGVVVTVELRAVADK